MPDNEFHSSQCNLRFAVILPVYNTQTYLCECLDSLLRQTYRNFMVFAIDDGSTDGSGNILDEYASKDEHIYVLHKENGGVSSTRNFGLEIVETINTFDYITFVDSDDIVKSDFLMDFAKHLSENSADLAICGIEAFDKVHIINDSKQIKPKQKLNNRGIANQFFSLEDWEDSDPTRARFLSNKAFSFLAIKGIRFNEKLIIGEDQEFFIRCLRVLQTGISFPTRNYRYRLRCSSLSHANCNLQNEVELFETILSESNLPDYVINGVEKSMLYSWWAALRMAFIQNDIHSIERGITQLQRIRNRNFIEPIEKNIENVSLSHH